MFEKEAEEYSRNFDWTNDDRIIDYSERGFKDGAEFGYNKANEYAKTIIKDLLDNSDEYARQRAMDFLENAV